MIKALLTALLLVPFFSHSESIFNFDNTVSPDQITSIECKAGTLVLGIAQGSSFDSCKSIFMSRFMSPSPLKNLADADLLCSQGTPYWVDNKIKIEYSSRPYVGSTCTNKITSSTGYTVGLVALVNTCPPEGNTTHSYSIDMNEDSETDSCADPTEIPLFDSCNINDSPNVQVTEPDACYTKSDGSSCSVSAVDVGGGNQVYQGSEGNCYADPQPDVSGNPAQGDLPISEECVNNGGLLACPEDPSNVCGDSGSSYGGGSVNNCQAGCDYVNDQFVCYDQDNDSDGLPDYNDPDIDGDGIANGEDLDADGDGLDDPIFGGDGSGTATGDGSGSGTGDIDLSPVTAELKKANTKLDDLLDQFKVDKDADKFDADGALAEENTQYKTKIEELLNKSGSSLGYSESVGFVNDNFASLVPVDGCSTFSIPVGFLGTYVLDLCEVSEKVKPPLAFIFGILAAFYVFITVNSTIRGAT